MLPKCSQNTSDSNALTDKMLTEPMMKQSYVKCQLLVGNIERDVIRKLSRLKQPYFNEVVEKIKETIF